MAPLSNGVRALSIYVPLVALFGLTCLATAPPLIVLMANAQGNEPVGVTVAVALLNVHAFFWGLLLVGLARLAVKHSRLPVGAVYPVAVAFWAVWAVTGLMRVGTAAPGQDPHGLAIAADLVLGSAAIFRLGSMGSTTSILVASSAIILAISAAFQVTICPTGSAAGLFDDVSRPVRVTWTARQRRGALLRLHLLRLLRNRRVVGSVGASFGVMIVACWYLSRTGPPAVKLGRSMLFPLSIGLSHVCLVARGLSPRHRPYPLILGVSSELWALSVVLAAFLLAFLPWVAFVSALAIILADWTTALVGVGLGLFVIGMALVSGALLVPGRENAGGEIVGLLLASVAAISCVQLLAAIGVTADTTIALVLAAVGAGLLGVPPLVERTRWRHDIGALR